MRTDRTTMTVAICVLLAFFPTLSVSADDDTPIIVDRLPAKSKAFLERHFCDKNMAYVVHDRDFLKVTYEVQYIEGIKVEFRKDGEWKEVNCLLDTVPSAIVPQPISVFITKHYPHTYICKIERDTKEYEVKLKNGLELTFGSKFHIVKIDD